MLVTLWLRLYISNIELAELLYISIKSKLGISVVNQFQCFVLTKVASQNVIMIILENIYVEITSRQYINFVVKMEKTIKVYRPLAICGDISYSNWATRKVQKDILVQCVQINHCSCIKERKEKKSSSQEDYKLLLSKYCFKVVRVDCSIASIPFFRIYPTI